MFMLIDNEIYLKKDIIDILVSFEDIVWNVILEIFVSFELEIFVSFDYEYYFCEVIDVSESFERYLDDSDYFDILIDGFVCKREMIRK